MSSSFPLFVRMVRRKITNKLVLPVMIQVYQDEVNDIVSESSLNEEAKIILLKQLLRGLKIPFGVEGGALSLRRRG